VSTIKVAAEAPPQPAATPSLALVMAAVLLQSCLGWGDMFAQKRTVVGDYFMMTGEGDEPEYYLLRRGQSVSTAGPLRSIGWDQSFILTQDAANPGGWGVFALDAARYPVPTNAAQRGELILRLKRTIRLRSPAEVWAHPPQGAGSLGRSSEIGDFLLSPENKGLLPLWEGRPARCALDEGQLE